MSDNVAPEESREEITDAIAKTENPPTEKEDPEKATPLLNQLLSSANVDQSRTEKYTRYYTDMEGLKDASHALPSVYKFFLKIYRVSPIRTAIIIAVYLLQGFLPALKLRTGGDFIRQANKCEIFCLRSVARWNTVGNIKL